MFEKIRGNDARFENILKSLYWDFKEDNKLSTEDILFKSKSLRGVLEPFSDFGNLGLMKRAGFRDIQPIMQSLCFKGYLCIKWNTTLKFQNQQTTKNFSLNRI